MWKWLHHLLDPHCEECNRCPTCEVLKQQVETERIFNKVLLDKLTEKDAQIEPQVAPVPPSAMPRTLTWRVRRQMLEADDRKAAALKIQKEQELQQQVTELEKEVGIVNADNS
jgi:hypothetical protein